jgi:hypothetical protein
MWDVGAVKFWLAIRRVIPVFAVLGLVLAPFTAPAVAVVMTAPMATTAGNDMAMAEDMPCCPPEKPVMPDCMKACPLLTLCFAKTFQCLVSSNAVLVRVGIAEQFVPGNEALLDTLAQGPPPRPPQS